MVLVAGEIRNQEETMAHVAVDMAARKAEYYRALEKARGSRFIRRVHICGLIQRICNDKKSPCPGLVLLYARLGLHRYNLLQGKNLELRSVKKYTQTTGTAAYTYHITMEAMDPAIDSLQTFETKVYENTPGELDLSCRIARPLGEPKENQIKKNMLKKPVVITMPEWPPQNPFENCYVLNESELELEENHWVRLYLELAVAKPNRNTNPDVSNLKIVKVAIDTSTKDADDAEELNGKNVAVVYIHYKDSCEARVGKDVDRVAIVRRAFCERFDCFSLVGQTLSSDIIPKKGKKKKRRVQLLPCSLRLKPWLLSSPRRLKAYKYTGVGLSRCLLKARSTIEYVD
ncbi:hypothetical protein EUTSA_v10027826mg [Eutrema salsugineum]|uniref:Uncharacterized protein n=1 Tax=Eutrema salsugineum TaxID=72664 RepID=V4LWC7_EUTSA|nr:UPF0725 protein EMB2204 [Eutrema salsugineum]ESQ46832.1 hypothetical protein EUTSA_v10027826mg [Eutrema salsugineum]